MATSRRKAPSMRLRTVRTKEDRKRPSVFMRLKQDESFRGVALFEPDPEAENNPGYLEYYDHWDQQGNTYVPCAGEDCPFCAANDNPSTRALTAWYFPEAADAKDQIKLFTMNYGTIEDITDESEEEDGVIGKKIRIKRLDDRGNYKVKILADKKLTQKQITSLLTRLEKEILQGKGLEGLVLSQLRRQLERLKAIDLLEEDEDDDEAEETTTATKTKTRRGKPAVEEEEDDDEDEDDEDEIEDEADDDDDEDEDEDEDDDTDDEDEDEDEDEDDAEDEDEDEDEDEADEISAGVYEIVSIQRRDEIFNLKNDDGSVKMWLGDGIDVDYEKIKKGVIVVVDAAKDDEGDWIITAIKPKASRGRPRTKK